VIRAKALIFAEDEDVENSAPQKSEELVEVELGHLFFQ
jgi:hypothetical protein